MIGEKWTLLDDRIKLNFYGHFNLSWYKSLFDDMVKYLHRLEDKNIKKWVETHFLHNNLIKSLFERNCVTYIANLVSTSYIIFENNSFKIYTYWTVEIENYEKSFLLKEYEHSCNS